MRRPAIASSGHSTLCSNVSAAAHLNPLGLRIDEGSRSELFPRGAAIRDVVGSTSEHGVDDAAVHQPDNVVEEFSSAASPLTPCTSMMEDEPTLYHLHFWRVSSPAEAAVAARDAFSHVHIMP